MAQIAELSEYGAERSAVEVESDGLELSLIQQAIINLSENDYRKLREWMEEEEEWDRQMEQAALDFLIESGAIGSSASRESFLIDEVQPTPKPYRGGRKGY